MAHSNVGVHRPTVTPLKPQSVATIVRHHWMADAAVAGSAGLGLVVLDSALGSWGQIVALSLIVVTGALAVELDLSERRRSGAFLAIVAGVVGLSIAAGYTISHLIEPSPFAAIVGGLTAVLWSLIMLSGAVRLLSPSSWLVRLGALALALVAAQFVLLPITAGTAGAHPPRIPIDLTTPAGAHDVSFPVADGIEVGGWYTPSVNGATIVLLPGAGGNRTGTIDHALVLTRHGYGVLALDARGSGHSSGIGNLWGWYGMEDINGAINWLSLQSGVDQQRIALVGLSMGGEQAVTMAPADHRVRAVVAEGVQGRVAADTWFIGDDLRALIERTVDAEVWAVADLWSAVDQPAPLRDVAAAITKPVLIIAADAADERAVSADLAARSPMIEVWQTTGIGHIQALALAPAEWETRVIAFLDQSLD